MNLAQAPQAAAKPIYLETPHLYMRTLTAGDASERFGAWFEQDEVSRGLNLAARKKTKAEIAAYIAGFDQVSKILLGIFDKTNDLLVSIITVHVDWMIGRFLANTVVGEAEYRHRGVMLEVSRPFRDYFFETLDLKVMTATALASNRQIIGYLEKTGWTRNQTLKNQVRSQADGAPADLCLYSLTREAWNVWKAANPGEYQAMLTAAALRT